MSTKVSEYSKNQLLEQLSVHYFMGICNKLKWKYRQYSQDNDIDGEIEIFEEDENIYKNLTTSKFIKIQLKAQNEVDREENGISYKCPIKLLKFVENCDFPVLLVIYCEKHKKAYWELLQKIIEKPEFKINEETITIKISDENCLDSRNLNKFESDIIKISREIPLKIQMRKRNINDYNFYEVIDSFYIEKNKGCKVEVFHIYVNPIFVSNNSILMRLKASIIANWSPEKTIDGIVIMMWDSLNKIGSDSQIYIYEEIKKVVVFDKIITKNINRRFENQKKYSKIQAIELLKDYYFKLIKIYVTLLDKYDEELIDDAVDIYNKLRAIDDVEEVNKGDECNIEFPFVCKVLLYGDLCELSAIISNLEDEKKIEEEWKIKELMERIRMNLKNLK